MVTSVTTCVTILLPLTPVDIHFTIVRYNIVQRISTSKRAASRSMISINV
jgi:hypothetical protein